MRSPVLFLIFNRPKVTNQVFEAIRAAKPKRLYIAADGPRVDREGEMEKCLETRRIIEKIDWPCDLKTSFQPKNLGPMHAQIGALNWFFMHEEEGIILEDDCLPDQSFFDYCDELLDRYRDDRRIFMISGNNFQGGIKRGDAEYYFSIYTHIWGWATWRRSWKCFDQHMTDWPSFKAAGGLDNLHKTRATRKYWLDLFDRIYAGSYKRGWDYRFLFACWRENGVAVIPQQNLVENVGFGADATNCKDIASAHANIKAMRLPAPMRHPTVMCRNIFADEMTSRAMFSHKTLLRRLAPYLTNPGLLLSKIFKKIKGVAV